MERGPSGVLTWQGLDFVAEWTDTQLPPLQIQAECWTMYFDGSVMKTGGGLLFISPLLALLKYPFYPLFILDNGMNSISKSLTVLTPA